MLLFIGSCTSYHPSKKTQLLLYLSLRQFKNAILNSRCHGIQELTTTFSLYPNTRSIVLPTQAWMAQGWKFFNPCFDALMNSHSGWHSKSMPLITQQWPRHRQFPRVGASPKTPQALFQCLKPKAVMNCAYLVKMYSYFNIHGQASALYAYNVYKDHVCKGSSSYL